MNDKRNISIDVMMFAVGLAAWILCVGSVHTVGNSTFTAYGYRVAEILVLAGGGFYTVRIIRAAIHPSVDPGAQVAEESYLSNFSGQIDRAVHRLRKMSDVVVILSFATAGVLGFLLLSAAQIMPLTNIMHWSPGTDLLIVDYPGYSRWFIIPVIIGLIVLFCTIGQLIIFRIGRSQPVGYRRAFEKELTGGKTGRGDIAFYVILAAGGLLLLGSVMHSYVLVTDRGVEVCKFPGLEVSFHDWSQVTSIKETHSSRKYPSRSGSHWRRMHYAEVTFSDGTNWRSCYVGDPGYEAFCDGLTAKILDPTMQYMAKRTGHTIQQFEAPAER